MLSDMSDFLSYMGLWIQKCASPELDVDLLVGKKLVDLRQFYQVCKLKTRRCLQRNCTFMSLLKSQRYRCSFQDVFVYIIILCPNLPFVHFSGRFVLQPNGVISVISYGFQEKLLKIQVGPGWDTRERSESRQYIFLNRHNKMIELIEDDLKIYWIRLSNLHLIQLYRPDGGRRFSPSTGGWPLNHQVFSLPDTNGSHPKMDAWNTILPFWILAYFQVPC